MYFSLSAMCTMHYKERVRWIPHGYRLPAPFRTLKRWKRSSPPALLHASVLLLHIDGVHTIIKMSTSYGTDLGTMRRSWFWCCW